MIKRNEKIFDRNWTIHDLFNRRYINRKPIYDFCIKHKNKITGTVLDFGCGASEYNECFTLSDRIIGLDIEDAKDVFGESPSVVYYDGHKIPFDNDFFDSAFSIQVFYCIKDYEYSMKEINRVLRQGGIFLVTFPFIYPEMDTIPDYHRFNKRLIEEKLFENGFEVLEICGSTDYKDTLRRCKIVMMRKKMTSSFLIDAYTIFSNLSSIMKRKKAEDSLAPMDYLVLCRKR